MEVVHPRCAGLDVHKKTVVACVLVPGRKEVRTFGTICQDLSPQHFDALDRRRATRRAAHRPQSLGFQVSLREVGA